MHNNYCPLYTIIIIIIVIVAGDQNLVGVVLGVLVGSGTILIVVIVISVILIGQKKVKLKGNKQ